MVCDRSPERLALVRERYHAVATCDRVEDLFARDDIEAVVIATPASTHEALVRSVLERGWHVLAEKPMALDAGGCAALCDLAESAGRVLMVGYTFLYNAGVRKMKEHMAPEPFGGRTICTRRAPPDRFVTMSTRSGTWRRTTSPSSTTCSTKSRAGRRRSGRASCAPTGTISRSPRSATTTMWSAISTSAGPIRTRSARSSPSAAAAASSSTT